MHHTPDDVASGPPFTATVTRSDTGETLATVSTKILVTGG